MICIITKPATDVELSQMSRMFGDYIKLAVDVERGILSGGGESHAECEAALLNLNSSQQNIWGAGLSLTQSSTFVLAKEIARCSFTMLPFGCGSTRLSTN